MAIIGKIYSNTLLASFNNRILFRENRTNHVRDQSVHAPLLFPEALAPRRSMDTPRVHIRTFNEEFISGKSVGSILPTQHTLHRAPSEPGTSVAPSTRKPSALLPLASRSSSPALVPSDPPTPPTPPTLLGSSDMGSEVIPLMQPSAYRHGIRPLPTLPADVGGRRVSFGVHQGYDAEV
ncbi:hypothetical protein BC834DRAFT_477889 [Gloeopeniophorella convolvens]|nr:hypothetical protein BC834DRAFT_477889 [Gloeopeniophorella convolvens]